MNAYYAAISTRRRRAKMNIAKLKSKVKLSQMWRDGTMGTCPSS